MNLFGAPTQRWRQWVQGIGIADLRGLAVDLGAERTPVCLHLGDRPGTDRDRTKNVPDRDTERDPVEGGNEDAEVNRPERRDSVGKKVPQ